MQQILGWRAMHSQGRGLNSVMINQLGDDVDTYTLREAEFCCNAIVGFNFGDGHLHDRRMIEAVQKRCRFEPGELIVVWAESEALGVRAPGLPGHRRGRRRRRARQLGGQGGGERAAVAAERPDPDGRHLPQARIRAREPHAAGRGEGPGDGMTAATIVGSGPNGLAAALTLAAEGVDVTVLEAAEELGGGTRSSELTLPGLIHDECSAAHPLALDTPFSRRFDLEAHGLTWRWPEVQYAHPLDGGAGAAAYRSVEQTAAGLGDDGTFVAEAVRPARRAVRRDHRRLHAPDAARAGPPAADGPLRPLLGAARRAAEGALRHAGGAGPLGRCRGARIPPLLGTDVVGDRGRARYGRACLRLAGRRRRLVGDQRRDDLVALRARREVRDRRARRVARRARRRRHRHARRRSGRRRPDRRRSHAPPDRAGADEVPPRSGDVQGRLRDRGRRARGAHEESRRAGTVHVGGSYDEIAAAERLVARGEMPDKPFVLVCQQYLADPGRSNGDVHPLYAYAHVPAGYGGDVTAQIEAQIERFAPGFGERVLARHVRSVAQMEAHNVNYVGGDVVTGSNDAAPARVPPARRTGPVPDGHPRRLPLLGGDPARRRRARHVRLQRGAAPPCGGSSTAISRPRPRTWPPPRSERNRGDSIRSSDRSAPSRVRYPSMRCARVPSTPVFKAWVDQPTALSASQIAPSNRAPARPAPRWSSSPTSLRPRPIGLLPLPPQRRPVLDPEHRGAVDGEDRLGARTGTRTHRPRVGARRRGCNSRPG